MTPRPTRTPRPRLGVVSGRLAWPEGVEPAPLHLYFLERRARTPRLVIVAETELIYETTLPPGIYTVYAWLPDTLYLGGYTEAVACGLTPACDDHTLRPFTIRAGQTTTAIDILDWNVAAKTIPRLPKALQTWLENASP